MTLYEPSQRDAGTPDPDLQVTLYQKNRASILLYNSGS